MHRLDPLRLTTSALTSAAAATTLIVFSGCQAFDPQAAGPVPAEPPISVTPAHAPTAVQHQSVARGLSTPNVARITWAEEGADFDPCVSRDGTRLVFASTQHRPTADIYIKNTASRVVTQLTTDPADDCNPSLSPDGNRIAFASNRSGNWDIYIMPVSGGKAMQVTNDPADELHPSWSPDGRELVYCRLGQISERWEMWVTDSANAATSHFIGYGLFPQWAPVAGTGEGGGDRIMFQLGRERGRRTYAIWTLDYRKGAAGNQSEIASSPHSALVTPSWSPDGQWVVYAEVPAPQGAANQDPTALEVTAQRPDAASLWMINVDGTGRVALASGMGSSLMPTWAPSNRLFFVSNRGGSENIWSLDLGSALLAAGNAQPTENPVANVSPQETGTEGR